MPESGQKGRTVNRFCVFSDYTFLDNSTCIGYALHARLVYSLTISALAKVSPITFFKTMAPVIPLGAIINMDGTAIYQDACAVIVSKLEDRKRK